MTPVAALMRLPELLPDGLDIGELDEIGFHLGGGLAAGFIVGIDEIRSDAADLVENIVAAGERDGDDQDDGRIPDDQTEGGQQRPNLVGSSTIDS